MGEAGPEAIMPLTRSADGSLGGYSVSGRREDRAAHHQPLTVTVMPPSSVRWRRLLQKERETAQN